MFTRAHDNALSRVFLTPVACCIAVARRIVLTRYLRFFRSRLPFLIPGLAERLEAAETRRRLAGPVLSLEEIRAAIPTRDIECHGPCPLCGSTRLVPRYHSRGLDRRARLWEYFAARCPECGLLYRIPGIKPERLSELYSGGHYAEFLDGVYHKGRVGSYKRTPARVLSPVR